MIYAGAFITVVVIVCAWLFGMCMASSYSSDEFEDWD